MPIEYRTNTSGPHLFDTEGGVWWPTEEARKMIECADDPEAEAFRLEREGGNGMWRA